MTGKHRPGTPRDRALGAELRAIRERAGLSLAKVAARIRWDVSTLSRLERGQRHISPEAVMGLSVIYELDTERRKELLGWSKKPATLGLWDRPPDGIPGELGALASYEREATRMTNWSPGVLPGMLQTPAYTEAMMRDDWKLSSLEIQARIERRHERQTLLERRGIEYTAFVGIAALRNMLCDRVDFAHQLRHLTRMGRRDGIEVRLVDCPTWLAIGGWYLMDFAGSGSVVHLEHLESATFLFDDEADPYLTVRGKLAEMALTAEVTRDRLERIIESCVLGSWP